jgi:hypothetical protein
VRPPLLPRPPQVLDLSWRCISDKEAHAIALMLRFNHSIARLELANCCLQPAGAAAIAQSLKYNRRGTCAAFESGGKQEEAFCLSGDLPTWKPVDVLVKAFCLSGNLLAWKPIDTLFPVATLLDRISEGHPGQTLMSFQGTLSSSKDIRATCCWVVWVLKWRVGRRKLR